MITKEQLNKALSYQEYKDLLAKLIAEGKTTGDTQTEEYIGYGKINLHRMQRLDKTIVLSEKLREAIHQISRGLLCVILTEGWCGDAAQNIPLFAAIEKENKHIQLRLLLRDENLPLMDQYLTNGSRSIPKVIFFEKNNLHEVAVWGPRPTVLQNEVLKLVAAKTPKEEKIMFVQQWYNADKTITAQSEIEALLNNLHVQQF